MHQLKKIRAKYGLSQSELSKALGMSIQWVQKVEQGYQEPSEIHKVTIGQAMRLLNNGGPDNKTKIAKCERYRKNMIKIYDTP